MNAHAPWTRRSATLLAAFGVVGGLNAGGLVALALGGARTLPLAIVAGGYAAAAARAALLLREGRPGRAARWVGVWAGLGLAVVGMVGWLYHPGRTFWLSAAGAVVSWGAVGWWLGRRVRAEAVGLAGGRWGTTEPGPTALPREARQAALLAAPEPELPLGGGGDAPERVQIRSTVAHPTPEDFTS